MWAKAKVIMRAKIRTILSGNTPNDEDYRRISRVMPDVVDHATVNVGELLKSSDFTLIEHRLANDIRQTARPEHGRVRHSKRVTFEKIDDAEGGDEHDESDASS